MVMLDHTLKAGKKERLKVVPMVALMGESKVETKDQKLAVLTAASMVSQWADRWVSRWVELKVGKKAFLMAMKMVAAMVA
jgi:hypothetical protein